MWWIERRLLSLMFEANGYSYEMHFIKPHKDHIHKVIVKYQNVVIENFASTMMQPNMNWWMLTAGREYHFAPILSFYLLTRLELWNWVNIDWGHGVLSDGTKPSSEALLS